MPVVSAELPEAAIAQLQKRADVTYVEDDNEWHTLGQTTPWGIGRIYAPSAWSEATGAGVDVAVLDSGVDYDHEDLAENFAGGVNWVGKHPKRDGSMDPILYDDIFGHGTHCASTIAAVNNEIGVVGVAPEARIWAVKVLDWIAMKSLEKNRTRRYDSAAELAADVQRHLNHEPVQAAAPSLLYKAQKFVRRNRVLVMTMVTVAFAIVLGLIATTVVYLRSEKMYVRSETMRVKAEEAGRKEAEARVKAEVASKKEADAVIAAVKAMFANQILIYPLGRQSDL